MRQLGGGKLIATASAGKKTFVGKSVQLQRMRNHVWTTIAKQQLGKDSTTVFELPPPGLNGPGGDERVNQAGGRLPR